jgi:flavin-dependent amine oxidoreductase
MLLQMGKIDAPSRRIVNRIAPPIKHVRQNLRAIAWKSGKKKRDIPGPENVSDARVRLNDASGKRFYAAIELYLGKIVIYVSNSALCARNHGGNRWQRRGKSQFSEAAWVRSRLRSGSPANPIGSSTTTSPSIRWAGDWIKTGLNCGCMEATVMSGMQAARAIGGFELTVAGETDFEPGTMSSEALLNMI